MPGYFSSQFFFIFSVLSEPERGSLSVIATVFDKLNHEYKKYLEAEQSYTMVNRVSYSSLQRQDNAGCFSGAIKVKACSFLHFTPKGPDCLRLTTMENALRPPLDTCVAGAPE